MESTKKTYADVVFKLVFILFVGCCLFIFREQAVTGALGGLELVGSVIIPTLFPFMVLSSFTVQSGAAAFLGRIFAPVIKRIFRIPGQGGVALVMSMVGGYPVGGRTIRDLYAAGSISRRDASRMLLFSVNAGPAFIVSAVGARMLRSYQAGVILLVAHIAASLLIGIATGLFSRMFDKRKTQAVQKADLTENLSGQKTLAFGDSLVSSTSSAASGMFSICAWVVLFAAITEMLLSLPLPGRLSTILPGLLEVTTGSKVAAETGNLPFMAAVLGWGGLSTHFQVLSSVSDLGISKIKFFAGRLCHALLSALITLPLCRLFPYAVKVFSNDIAPTPIFDPVTLPASAALALMCVMLLYAFSRQNVVRDKPYLSIKRERQ